jgi:hypothetical protein
VGAHAREARGLVSKNCIEVFYLRGVVFQEGAKLYVVLGDVAEEAASSPTLNIWEEANM